MTACWRMDELPFVASVPSGCRCVDPMPSGLGPAAWKGPALSLPGEMTSDHSRAVGFQFPGSLYNSPASSLCAFNEKLGCGGVVSTAVELLSA